MHRLYERQALSNTGPPKNAASLHNFAHRIAQYRLISIDPIKLEMFTTPHVLHAEIASLNYRIAMYISYAIFLDYLSHPQGCTSKDMYKQPCKSGPCKSASSHEEDCSSYRMQECWDPWMNSKDLHSFAIDYLPLQNFSNIHFVTPQDYRETSCC